MFIEKTFEELELDLAEYHDWLKSQSISSSPTAKRRFLTISREFGCDGIQSAIRTRETIAAKTGEKWMIFSHSMLDLLAADSKLGATLIADISETRYKFFNWFVDGLVPDFLKSAQSETFIRLRTLILNIIDKGNCIIVGGGAQVLAHKLDPAKFMGLRFRLIGSEGFRLENLRTRRGLSPAAAEDALKSRQGARTKFVRDFTGFDVADKDLYHLIINNDLNRPERIASVIFEFMRLNGFFGTGGRG